MKLKRLLVLVLSMLLGLFALSACAQGNETDTSYAITYYAVIDGVKQSVPDTAKEEGKTYPTEYEKGKSTTIPNLKVTCTITVDGAEKEVAFGGWFTDEACTQAFTGITTKTTGNITLYAKFTGEPSPVKRTITYKAVFGSTIGDIPNAMFKADGDYPIEYVEGVSVLTVSNLKDVETFEENGSGENYTFKGWFIDEACTQEFTGITTEMSGNITIYALVDRSFWSPIV